MKKHRLLLAVLVGYTGIVIVVFGSSLWPTSGMMIYGDDIHRAYYFFRQFFHHWITQGVFPWWNPYMYGGEPFVANPIANIWYPPTWMFVFLPLNRAYSWHLALHVWWAMLGMYVFSKQLTVNSLPVTKAKQEFSVAAFVSGVIFGLSGFFMARTFAGHVDVVAAASWMPWVVCAFWRLGVGATVANKNLDASPVSLAESRRSTFNVFSRSQSVAAQNFISSPHRIVVASVVFALQLLAGYQTMAFMTVIVVVVVTSIYCYIVKSWKPLFLAAISGTCGVALAAIGILPVQEFFRASIRTYPFPYSWISYGSIPWQSLWQLFNPFFFGNQFTYHGPPPNFIEHAMFVGVGGLILAAIGLLRSLRGLRSLSFVFIVIFGLWVSMGPNAPFDLQKLLWQTVPMYQYLRIPPRHLILVVFGLSALAGIGFDRLPKLPRALRGLIAGVVVIEMIWFGRGFIQLKEIPESRHDTALIALLKQDKEPYRVLQNFGVWLPQRDVLDFDSVMSYGIYSATGYDPSILRSYYEYMAQASGTTGEKAVVSTDVQVPYLGAQSALALDFLNIKYIMVPFGYDPFSANNRYRLIKKDDVNEYRLYENTTVKSRFFFSDPSCGDIQISSLTPNVVQLSTQSSCDQQLQSSEVMYPGWRAYIDGKRTDIVVSNTAFRTLFVPAGNHTIVYRYVPTIFMLGGAISLITGLCLLAWVYRSTTNVHPANI